MENKEYILEVKNLTIYYQTKIAEIQAINNLSFKSKKGEFIAIIGKSGCGKTSILSAIAGLIPYEGKILFNNPRGEENTNPSIGYMLQRDELFPWLTIEQNVILPLKIKKKLTKEKHKSVLELLTKYGLDEFKSSYLSSSNFSSI